MKGAIVMPLTNSFTPIWADPTILNTDQYIAIIISILLSLLLPLILMVVFAKKVGFRPMAVGALCFIVMQMLIRIPLLNTFQQANVHWLQTLTPQSLQYHTYLIVLSLTAGLVEEWGRYAFMRLMLKNKRSTLDGVAFGVGHGGIEAILIVGVSLLTQLLLTPQVYASSPPLLLSLGGVERVFAMSFHIGMSVLIIHHLTKIRFVWLAVLLHTLFNYIPLALIPLLNLPPHLEPLAMELLLLLFAAASLWYVFYVARKKTQPQ